ncbi:MAG: glycosyltransferase [Candidatus Magnetoovum sp. WYHC-5]|nr:glycosyltransferase [Candidatus Magnetoovum sp. WYHC-5]
MEILSIGNFSSIYIKDSWVEPLKRLYDAHIVDVIPLVLGRHFDSSYCTKYLESLVRNGSFDYIFFYSDGMHTTLVNPDNFFQISRHKGIKVIAFHADDEPQLWYNMNKRFEHRYDVVATHSRRAYELRLTEGWQPERLIYMPWGYNPKVFCKLPNINKKYDVIFIGKCKSDTKNGNSWEDGLQRNSLLSELYDFCLSNGIRFRLFGFGWDKHPHLAKAYGGVLTNDEMVKVYNEANIVFNPAYSADEDYTGYQTKLRHFEVAGCGAFQITNENPELADMFQTDKEICYYKDKKELFDKILYYLKNAENRETIALNSLKRAQANHTTDNRLRALFDMVAQAFPPLNKKHQQNKLPNIGRILISANLSLDINDNENTVVLPTLQALYEEAPRLNGNFDYIQIFTCNTNNITISTDYRALFKIIKNDTKADILSMRSICYSAPGTKNFIQVHRYNYNGMLLANDIDTYPLDIDNERSFEKYLLPIKTQEGQNLYLFNFLIRPAFLLDFLNAVKTGSIKSLRIINTYVIVNELFINGEPETEIPYFHFKTNLREICKNLSALDKKVVIYGARGELAPLIFEEIKKSNVTLLGFIDRAMAGKKIEEYPVYASDALKSLNADVVIVAATASGPEIYKSIVEDGHHMCVIPAYELGSQPLETAF